MLGSALPGAKPASGQFATTRWTVVIAAQDDSDRGREALEQLCHSYWLPIYSLVRRRGLNAETARDLTQEFFAQLLSRDGLAKARREKGRFRSFLAQSVQNFLSDQWDKSRAQKRGGAAIILSLEENAEKLYAEMPPGLSPDILFDRQWAEALLNSAKARLEQEFEAEGKGALLQILAASGDPQAPTLQTEAIRLGIPVNTLKSHLHRARARHAQIIRALVAETVPTAIEVDAELRHLLAAISN